MSYVRYLCLLVNNDVQHNCVVFLFCFSSSCVPYTMLPVSLDYPFLIANSVLKTHYTEN